MLSIVNVDFNSFDDITALIHQESSNVRKSFITIGCLLSYMVDTDMLFLSNYLDIFDYCEQVFHFSRTTVKNLISIANKFCCENAAILKSSYEDYSYSQLVELLPVDSEDITTYITPDMSVRQIKEWKKSKRAASHRSSSVVNFDCCIYDDNLLLLSRIGLQSISDIKQYFDDNENVNTVVLKISRGE